MNLKEYKYLKVAKKSGNPEGVRDCKGNSLIVLQMDTWPSWRACRTKDGDLSNEKLCFFYLPYSVSLKAGETLF